MLPVHEPGAAGREGRVVESEGNRNGRQQAHRQEERRNVGGKVLTDAAKAESALRAHWGIENNLHWILDTVFEEDACLVRKDNSAQNLNIIRKIVINILKQVDFSDVIKSKNIPLVQKQRLCDKREDCLDRVLKSF